MPLPLNQPSLPLGDADCGDSARWGYSRLSASGAAAPAPSSRARTGVRTGGAPPPEDGCCPGGEARRFPRASRPRAAWNIHHSHRARYRSRDTRSSPFPQLFRKYGTVAVGVHFTVYFTGISEFRSSFTTSVRCRSLLALPEPPAPALSPGVCYAALQSNVDVKGMLQNYGLMPQGSKKARRWRAWPCTRGSTLGGRHDVVTDLSCPTRRTARTIPCATRSPTG